MFEGSACQIFSGRR